MFTFLGGFEVRGNEVEFWVADHNLGHGETDAELSASNEASSKFIEVAEELSNSNSLLAADLTDAGKHIINVFGGVAHNLSGGDAGLGFGEIVEGVVEVTADTKQFVGAVNFIAKIDVVYLINVSLVHVTAEESLSNVVRCADLQKINYTQELLFGNVAVLCDIEVLENRLEQNTTSGNSLSVFAKNGFNVNLFFRVEVLAAGQDSFLLSDGGYMGYGVLLDSVSSESFVY